MRVLTIVTDELEGRGQGVKQLGVDATSGIDRGKGAVRGGDAVEGAGLGLGDERLTVGGLGSKDVGDVGEGGPGRVGAEVAVSLGSGGLTELIYGGFDPRNSLFDFAQEQDLGLGSHPDV